MLNVVIVQGNLTRDPELQNSRNGTAFCRFAIANNGTKKDATSFFNCVAFDKTAELIAEYFSKGRQILVQGRLEERKWEDKDGQKRSSVQIVANTFDFVSDPRQNDEQKEPGQQEASYAEPSDDDVPF